MSILQAIQNWGMTLPAWQQDAIGRLFAKGTLAASDEDDLCALLKIECGIPDEAGRIAVKLAAAQIAPNPAPKSLVQITAIKNLINVNALAEDKVLSVAPQGLTVIYGDNGSGKSGYSRVLKKACRARDQSEPILPNANNPARPRETQATFDLLIDGNPQEVTWSIGKTSPAPLSSISIFDSHCARAYLDKEDDFSYVPYGLDICEGLAKLCNKLKAKIESEQANNRPNLIPFSKLSSTTTAVGRLLNALNSKTKPEDVERLATLTEEELEHRLALEKSLKEGNPKEKAQQLRLLSGRIKRLAERCSAKFLLINAAEVEKLRKLIEASSQAATNAKAASKLFMEREGQLPGTGGEVWQALFEAARAFAVESHAGKEFPHLGPQDQCPLCQQPLNDASARLVAFDEFIQGEMEKAARTSRTDAETAFREFKQTDLNILLDDVKEELLLIDQPLTTACEAFQKAINTRKIKIIAACSPAVEWETIGDEPASPATELEALSVKLTAEAEALDKASDEQGRRILENEFKELDARFELASLKAEVLDAIAKTAHFSKLAKCVLALRTNAITAKSTELTEQVVSKELETALNGEFKKLDAGSLKVKLKSSSVKGKTQHKLILEMPSSSDPTDILSEGEQRAIAIASFLAEVNIGGGNGGIIFDDPVSSLDHRRRAKVAARLAEEAGTRQVIILTHDLYFLILLQQECKTLGINVQPLSLNKTQEGFGVPSDELPFDGLNTAKRVGVLRTMHVDCARHHKAGDEKSRVMHTRNAYFHLRLTWERAVEEVLLKGVVMRFGEGVQTQRLAEVVVDDEDYFAVDAGMSKCSKYAHDGPAAANVPTPEPDELEADINTFEAWRKGIEKRKDEIRGRRKR